MNEEVFIGRAVSSGSGNGNVNIHYLSHFVASFTGLLTRIGLWSLSAGSVKLNLYDVIAGVPVNLLFANDTGILCSPSQNNFIDVSASKIRIIKDVEYALGAIQNAPNVITYNPEPGMTRSYKAGLDYDTFVAPDPISGYATQGPIAIYYSYVAYGIPDEEGWKRSNGSIRNGCIGNGYIGTGRV